MVFQAFAALKAILRLEIQGFESAPDRWGVVVHRPPHSPGIPAIARLIFLWFQHTDAVRAVASVSWQLWGRVGSLSPPRTVAPCPNLAEIGENLTELVASSNPGPARGRNFLLAWGTHAG